MFSRFWAVARAHVTLAQVRFRAADVAHDVIPETVEINLGIKKKTIEKMIESHALWIQRPGGFMFGSFCFLAFNARSAPSGQLVALN